MEKPDLKDHEAGLMIRHHIKIIQNKKLKTLKIQKIAQLIQ